MFAVGLNIAAGVMFKGDSPEWETRVVGSTHKRLSILTALRFQIQLFTVRLLWEEYFGGSQWL